MERAEAVHKMKTCLLGGILFHNLIALYFEIFISFCYDSETKDKYREDEKHSLNLG